MALHICKNKKFKKEYIRKYKSYFKQVNTILEGGMKRKLKEVEGEKIHFGLGIEVENAVFFYDEKNNIKFEIDYEKPLLSI